MTGFYFLMGISLIANTGHCFVKVWTHDTDIYDSKNWQTRSESKQCKGLIFSETTHLFLAIKQLRLSSLTLPKDGQLFFPGDGEIIFDEHTMSDLNCVKLKPLITKNWLDFTGWNNTDEPFNPAVPYDERAPSEFDDIIIPKGMHSHVFLDGAKVKSLTYGQDHFTSYEKIQNKPRVKSFIGPIKITGRKCTDVTGCVRRLPQYSENPDECLKYVPSEDKIIKCENPIRMDGFCFVPKCGAVITIKGFNPGFRLDQIQTKLKEFKSFTHVSKVWENPSIVQVIFVEEDYNGNSVIEATEFFDLLTEDKSYFCYDLQLQISGPSLSDASLRFKNALSVIFGSLLGVLVTFGLVFYVYSPSFRNLNVTNRLLGNRPLSTYILRYDNIEDRGYIIDGQSVAGSITNLNESFDNPMYQYKSSSSSNETVHSKLKDDIKEERSASIAELEKDVGIVLKDI